MLDLESTELLRATARLLSKIHTVRLYTKREKMNLEQFYDFSQTILQVKCDARMRLILLSFFQLCGSLENKRLLLRVTSEEGRELPSVDELRENFSGYSPSFEQKMYEVHMNCFFGEYLCSFVIGKKFLFIRYNWG